MRAHPLARSLAALSVVAVLAAGCGNSTSDDQGESPSRQLDATVAPAGDDTSYPAVDAPGVSADKIRVASITSTTNPLGGNYGDLNAGIEAYFAKVNSEGGVYGRALDLAVKHDDQVGNNATDAESVVARDNVFAAFIASLLFTGGPVLAKAGVPTFGWNINPEWAGVENFFPNEAPVCFTCSKRYVPWVAGKENRTRVAVLAYNTAKQSTDCAKGWRKSFDEFGGDVGARVVFEDDALGYGQTDMSAQVAAMKRAGADMVVTCMDYNGVFTLKRELLKRDMHPLFLHSNMYDAPFVKQYANLLEGDFIVPRFTAFEHQPQIPAVREFLKWADKTDTKVSELTIHGWIAAMQLVDGLRLAGERFSRQKVVGALNHQTAWDADGLIPPIDWTKQHADPDAAGHSFAEEECTNFVRVRGGKMESALTTRAGTYVCFDNAARGLGEPVWRTFGAGS
jgi:ABC-type branched-subunit amino acid transport system substrate-binding protein